MKVAIVHDWLNQIGGAEGVLEALVEMFPGAPVYTSIYWREGMPAAYRQWDIRTTWMDRLPGIYRHHQLYLLLYPLAFGGLTLDGYDLVLSNKSAFCLGVQTSPGTQHICYCLTPTRFVWDFETYVGREQVGALAQALVRPFLGWLQRWERAAADRVDAFVAISNEVQARIRRLYGRESTIIYPPVDTRRFAPAAEPRRLLSHRLAPDPIQAHRPGGAGLYRAGVAALDRRRGARPGQPGGDGRTQRALPGPRARPGTRRVDGPLPGLCLSRPGGFWHHAGGGHGRRPPGDRLCRRRRAGLRGRGRHRDLFPRADARVAGRGRPPFRRRLSFRRCGLRSGGHPRPRRAV